MDQKKKIQRMLPVVLVKDLVRTVVAIKSSTTAAATQTVRGAPGWKNRLLTIGPSATSATWMVHRERIQDGEKPKTGPKLDS